VQDSIDELKFYREHFIQVWKPSLWLLSSRYPHHRRTSDSWLTQYVH
jgi:hypothetical protein